MKLLIITLLIVVDAGIVSSIKPPVQQAYDIQLEQDLRDELLSGYEAQQRPNRTVNVAVSLTLLTINDLNIKHQTLSLSGYFTLTWKDSRLSWSNASQTKHNYTEIHYMFIKEKFIWKPAVIIENAVDDITVVGETSVPMRITQDGHVITNPAGVYKVSCTSNTKYYPMDTQNCYITVSGWQYTTAELQLSFASDPVDDTFFTENGEWILLSVNSFKTREPKRSGHAFSSVLYHIKLQRRLLFHVINMLIPVSLMAILIAFVFKLPVESGEKVGFSITVLLSYAVYLTLISDHIPSTSVTLCFLSLYLVLILLLATIAVCCVTLVINLHMRTDDDKMPDMLKTFTYRYLLKIAYLKNVSVCRKKNQVHDEKSLTYKNDIPPTDKSNVDLGDPSAYNNSFDLTWKELSRIMDKVFYNVYMFLIILSTTFLFVVIIYGHATE